MYKNDAQKVLTGEVRLSYCNLTEARARSNDPKAKPKYSVTLLIPKKDEATIADIRAAINAAIQDALPNKWNGVKPPQVSTPIHDGDGVKERSGEPYGEECKGCYILTASSVNKPQVVDKSNINCELAPSDIYSGMYARVTLRFYGYNYEGTKGIACGLGNVMKTRDGEPLSGGATAAEDFEGVGDTVGYTEVDPITGLPIA